MYPPIGARLKRARLAKGLRLLEVARQIGCSESLLSKIENDRQMPSIVLLHKLTAALDSSIAALLAEADDTHDVVIRKADRKTIDFSRVRSLERTSVERIAPHGENALLQLMIFTVEPGGRTVGTLRHQGEDFGYVLEGEIDIIVDDVAYPLEVGDAFQFASDRPHGYHNRGRAVARVLWVNTPPTF